MPRRSFRGSRRSRRRHAAAKAALAVLSAAALALLLVAIADRSAGEGPRAGATIRSLLGHVVAKGDQRSGASASQADGAIPDGSSLSPFDDGNAAIARLRPGLRAALQRAAADARDDGIELRVNSGWRSAAYQQQLLDRAVVTYGSEQVARQYVNTPARSTHVRGEAVDVGPTDADSWLAQHGARYGLCQTYANEMWHFQLATEPGGTCPPQIADASGG